MQSLLTWVPVALALLIVGASDAHGRDPRPVDSSGYSHDRFGVEPKELMRDYGSFIVSFDSDDDDDGDGGPDNWGIPVWVAHEIKAFNEGSCIKTGPRPKWFTDTRLAAQGVAPRDATYVYSRTFRKLHPDWYVRGHLAMKFLAERMGPDAAWNTHTLLNAVPQRQSFNAGPWLELEELTGAWAQRFGAVWIITGPIIIDGKPSAFIGEEGEIPAAIPDALFKIVVRDSGVLPEALAFIYPQVGPGYQSGESPAPDKFLTSIDEIEKITGLDFLTSLSTHDQATIESEAAAKIWEVDRSDFRASLRIGELPEDIV